MCTLSGTDVEERFHWALFVQVSLLEWADQTSAVSLIICMLHGCETLFTGLLFPCTGQLCIDLSVLNFLSRSHCYRCFLALQYVCHSLHLLWRLSAKLQCKMKHLQKQLFTSLNSWSLHNHACWEASCTFFAASWIRYFSPHMKYLWSKALIDFCESCHST